jgi:hypothetical protein
MFVSVTRLRLRSWLLLLKFVKASRASVDQSVASPGFLDGATLIDKGLVFWTCTVWRSEADMKAFRGSGAHGDIMPLLRQWCSEAATAHFTRDSPDRPSWVEAHGKLVEAPRFQTLDNPGPRHTTKILPLPSTSAWRDRPFRSVRQTT